MPPAASSDRAVNWRRLLAVAAVIAGAAAVIAISARPGSRRHGVVLEAVPAKGRSTQLWSPKPASGLPTEFADAAERVRIETAIRLAAEQLDKEKIAQVRYTKEHDDAVAREHKDEMEAKALHAKAVSLAQKAIEQRTTFHVEQDRAATANKEISLEKRIASLMASKSEALKSQAEQSVRVAHEAGTEAEHLEHKIRKLEHETKEKGQHATVMVDTAKRLLQSARAMSQAAEAKAAKQATLKAPEDNSLLARLNEHQRLAHEAMKYDLTRLARAQLKVKQLTGVEGIDEVSRASEGIRDVQHKIDALRASHPRR
jgi:hypothetical protein